MKAKLIVLCSLISGSGAGLSLAQGQGQEPTQLLPTHGIYKLEITPYVDGKPDLTKTSTHRFKISVINKRLSGTNTAAGWERKGHMVGEVVAGKTAIIFIRQDGTEPKGAVAHYSGKMAKQGIIEGTLYDTEGFSGAFTLSLEMQD